MKATTLTQRRSQVFTESGNSDSDNSESDNSDSNNCPPPLKICNLIAGCVHICLVFFCFIYFPSGTNIILTSEWKDEVNLTEIYNTNWYANLTCNENGITYMSDANATDWFDCNKKNSLAGQMEFSQKGVVYELPYIALLIAFCFITAFFHFILCCYYNTYNDLLKKKLQPWRWVEYSITSAIMMTCIVALNRITDVWLHVFIFTSNICLNITGGLLTELISYMLGKYHKLDAQVSSLLWWTRLGLYVLSWSIFAMTWIVIFNAYFSSTAVFLGETTGEAVIMWEYLFTRITRANWGLFGLYFLFPLLHVFQVFNNISEKTKKKYMCLRCFARCCCSYRSVEYGYIVASMVAKLFLVLAILIPSVTMPANEIKI